MKIYDVSMTISPDIQVYKNKEEKKPIFSVASSFETGSTYETNVTLNLHTGTHLDFPLHVSKNGKNANSLDLSSLIRCVKVLDLTHVIDHISTTDLEKFDIQPHDFLLFKTKNSYEEAFNFNFIYLEEKAAIYLKNKGIKGVGIDALGIERNQAGHKTHHALLDNDILIIEGLRLKDVTEGTYMMYANPIKMKDVEALLLSVILIEGDYDTTSNIR